MPADTDDLMPLSDWIRGTLTLHFAKRGTFTRVMTLADAKVVQGMLDKKRSSDRLAWSDLSWTGFRSKKVLATEFDPDEDFGWGLSRSERAILAKHGYPHGILRTLHAHWESKGTEPSYTAFALYQLNQAALGGMSVDHFGLLAEALEGVDAEQALQRIIDEIEARGARPTRSTNIAADDTANPDDAPATPPAGEPAASDDAGWGRPTPTRLRVGRRPQAQRPRLPATTRSTTARMPGVICRSGRRASLVEQRR